MTEKLYGYTGKLLRVHLTERTYTVEDIPVNYMKDYMGGRGFIARYCYDEIQPGTDPVGPDNKVVFALGPLNGTKIASSGRYAVGSLSPHTGTIMRCISGGAWGAQLRFAGYDMLILEGASDDWIYLSVTEDGVEFRDARGMLGLLTEETEEAIREDLGNRKAVSAVIGPAGEKQVTFACIQTERRSAGRGGLGCVLGSKRVKGIAVYGTRRPVMYAQEKYDAMAKAQTKTNFGCSYYNHFHTLGTTGGLGLTYTLGVLPVKNFQKSVFEGVDTLMPDWINNSGYKVKDTGCWNCYMQCASLFDVPDGPFKGKNYENPEYETMWGFGAHCMNSDFAAILAANKICDDYGADTISTSNGVGFLMECYEKGYVTKEDLNGIELKWGDPESMVEVTRQIVTGSSRAGAMIAAGGVTGAAKKIGRDSADFAIAVKGLEIPAYDPRGLKAHGLGYATSNMGGHHQIGYSMQELFGVPEKVDRFSVEDKGRHTVWVQRFIMIYDCAVICGFPHGFVESKVDFSTISEWLIAATGMEAAFGTSEAIDAIFDRIWNLERAFNIRFGFGKETDTMPRRLLEEPLIEGPSAGHVWERDPLLADYYRVRGWDPETGVPTRETLEKYGLDYVADDLAREGYYERT